MIKFLESMFFCLFFSFCQSNQSVETIVQKKRLHAFVIGGVAVFGISAIFYFFWKNFLKKNKNFNENFQKNEVNIIIPESLGDNNGLKIGKESDKNEEKLNRQNFDKTKNTRFQDVIIKFEPKQLLDQKINYTDYDLLTSDQYWIFLENQYVKNIKTTLMKDCKKFNEQDWNDFVEERKIEKIKQHELFKMPLENNEFKFLSSNLNNFIAEILIMLGFHEDSICYKRIRHSELKENPNIIAYITNVGSDINDKRYKIFLNSKYENKDSISEYLKHVIFHEFGHLFEVHPTEEGLLRVLADSKWDFWHMKNKNTFNKLTLFQETIADRRLSIINSTIAEIMLRQLIIRTHKAGCYANIPNKSNQRISTYQQLVHALDLWYLLYERPFSETNKVIQNYSPSKNDYSTVLQRFFSKENIKNLLETDDSEWDVKRIRTADYPPKFIEN